MFVGDVMHHADTNSCCDTNDSDTWLREKI